MKTSKIIRHRHTYHHYMNDHLISVEDQDHWKLIFSDPNEMDRFQLWMKENKGEYVWDKEKNEHKGKTPDLKVFEGKDPCFCDIFTYYLTELAGYTFHSALLPYRIEIYTK